MLCASQYRSSSSNTMGVAGGSNCVLYQLPEMRWTPADTPETSHAAMPEEKAEEEPMIFDTKPAIHERPVTLEHPATQVRSGGVYTLGETCLPPQQKVQTHLKFHKAKTVDTPGRKQAKHSKCGQAAAMHCNMLKQAGVEKKTLTSLAVSSSGKEGWSREEWEVVRRRLEEAGEVAMTLVYKDGSSQLRPAQVIEGSPQG